MRISRSAILCEARSVVLVTRRCFDDMVEVHRGTLIADITCLPY